MKQNNRLGFRHYISWTLLAGLVLLSAESSGQEVDQATAGPRKESLQPGGETSTGRLVHAYFKVAGQLGWDTAGIVDIGMTIGKPAFSLHVSLRALAGISAEYSYPCQGLGANVGYRGIWRVGPRLRLTFMAAPLFLYRRSKSPSSGTIYRFNIPALSVSFGLVFGGKRRIYHGVEASSDFGYAFQFSPDSDDGRYSAFYGNASVGYMLMF